MNVSIIFVKTADFNKKKNKIKVKIIKIMSRITINWMSSFIATLGIDV
jgi:hypothetical protein